MRAQVFGDGKRLISGMNVNFRERGSSSREHKKTKVKSPMDDKDILGVVSEKDDYEVWV